MTPNDASGLARLRDDVARAADDRRPAVFIGDRYQRDVFDEVDVEEMVGLLLRELPLGGKEAMVKQLSGLLARAPPLSPRGPPDAGREFRSCAHLAAFHSRNSWRDRT